MAIAFFYAVATALGGLTGPTLFGRLVDNIDQMTIGFYIAAGLMVIAAITEFVLGIDAEGETLEDIATPLTAEGAAARRGAPRRALLAPPGAAVPDAAQRRLVGDAAGLAAPARRTRDIDREVGEIVGALGAGRRPAGPPRAGRPHGLALWGAGRFSTRARDRDGARRGAPRRAAGATRRPTTATSRWWPRRPRSGRAPRPPGSGIANTMWWREIAMKSCWVGRPGMSIELDGDVGERDEVALGGVQHVRDAAAIAVGGDGERARDAVALGFDEDAFLAMLHARIIARSGARAWNDRPLRSPHGAARRPAGGQRRVRAARCAARWSIASPPTRSPPTIARVAWAAGAATRSCSPTTPASATARASCARTSRSSPSAARCWSPTASFHARLTEDGRPRSSRCPTRSSVVVRDGLIQELGVHQDVAAATQAAPMPETS